MGFRHEFKHEITFADALTVSARLRAIAKPDEHSQKGKYEIRSIYFDNIDDRALLEKINGVNKREKFRIRYYNGDLSFIRLEKKSKINGLCLKDSAVMTLDEVKQLLDGNTEWMKDCERPVITELYYKMKTQGLEPKTIVDYSREAFVFPAGNVRVTIDSNIRTGMLSKNFLSNNCVTVPAGESPIILEVKWDEFLPDIIKDAVSLPNRRAAAYSKYAACRIYG